MSPLTTRRRPSSPSYVNQAGLLISGAALSPSPATWQALEGFKTMCKTEGIIPALEPSHAVYQTIQLAKVEIAPRSRRNRAEIAPGDGAAGMTSRDVCSRRR